MSLQHVPSCEPTFRGLRAINFACCLVNLLTVFTVDRSESLPLKAFLYLSVLQTFEIKTTTKNCDWWRTDPQTGPQTQKNEVCFFHAVGKSHSFSFIQSILPSGIVVQFLHRVANSYPRLTRPLDGLQTGIPSDELRELGSHVFLITEHCWSHSH